MIVFSKGTTVEKPQYYGPADFYIGATIEVFRQRFIIRSADLYVLKYAEENPEQFTPAVIQSLREHLSNQSGRTDARLSTDVRIQRKPGDFQRLYSEVRNKIKHMRITNHEQMRQMFLRYDRDRNGFVSRENIIDLFRQINLPLENDLIDAVSERERENVRTRMIDIVRFVDDCGMYNQSTRQNQFI